VIQAKVIWASPISDMFDYFFTRLTIRHWDNQIGVISKLSHRIARCQWAKIWACGDIRGCPTCRTFNDTGSDRDELWFHTTEQWAVSVGSKEVNASVIDAVSQFLLRVLAKKIVMSHGIERLRKVILLQDYFITAESFLIQKRTNLTRNTLNYYLNEHIGVNHNDGWL